MEDKLQLLYDSYIENGLLSSKTTFEQFSEADQSTIENLFQSGIDKNIISSQTDIETFSSAWLKKKDDSQSTGEEEVMVSDTEVVEQPGSSVPSATNPEQNIVDPNEVVDETIITQEEPEQSINSSSYDEDLTEEEILGLSRGEEDTAIERALGKNEFTDFFGDMWRAGSQGQAQGDVVDNALEIFGKGTSASDQDIEEFIIAHNAMAAAGPSDEMKDFDRVYEAAGGGIFGFLKGLIESPTLAPQLFVSSMSAMVNPASLAAAGATTAGFAGVGSMAGGIGAIPGAVLSIPFAMGAAGATLETGLSFAEFLNEELKEKGLKFTKKDVKKVLNDPEAMIRIRAKAAGRGAVIGIIDRYTAGLGGKLVGGMVKSGAKKGARILAAAGVEAAGGSAGEAAARLAVGQEMDIKEIGFEGIAGMSTTPVTYAYGTLLAKPVFKVNDGVVDRATILEMINTPDDKAFAGMELEIKNDPELKAIAEARKTKLRQESGISKQLKEAGITDEAAITELTALEREKQALEGNTTRAGKLKLKEIDAKIDAVMEGIDIDVVETTDDQGNTTTETVVITKEYAREKLMEEGVEFPVQEQIEAKQAQLMEEGEAAIAEMKTKDELATQDSDSVKRETYETTDDNGDKITVKVTTAKDGSRLVSYFNEDGQKINTETYGKSNTTTNEKIIETNIAEEGADITNTETIEGWENLHSEKQIANRKLKIKQDAIQESSTESVDVQERTTDSKEVGDGNTQGDITQESIESEADTETQSQEEIDTESRDLESFLNDNDVVVEETETTVDATPEAEVNTDETVVEAVTPDADGNLNIIESIEGSQVNLPGQQVDNTLSVTEKTTEQNDNHYSSDIFAQENPNATVEQHENKIISLAKKASKAITKLLPNTKIVIHRSEAAYNKFVTGKGTRGTFDPNTNTIHINMPKANGKTIAHEIFHAVLYDRFGSDVKIAEVTKRMFDAVNRKITDKKLKKELQDFSDRYSEFQNEEYLSELVGILADNYPSLSTPEKSIIKRWLVKLGSMIGISPEIDTDADVLNLLDTIGKSVKEGKEITSADIKQLDMFEQGEAGGVGTIKVKDQKNSKDAPKAESDSRPFSSLVKNKDIQDFEGKSFVTNMYDFTTAGPIDLGNGNVINLFGGKSYVPFMMERQGLSIGDVSNLAAFNTQSQAEGFIRNSEQGNASLFMPHAGTVTGSWQFQQSIFESLVNIALDNKIISKKELISTFNEVLNNAVGKKSFAAFKKKYGKNIKNFNSFAKNPLELVELLNTDNNYSPDLRKALNDKLSANKKFQKAIGVKSKAAFSLKMEDPLNKGVESGDLMGIVEFDNTTFEINKPKKTDIDYHPSFAWTVKAKIKGIYQPTNFQKSYDVTKSYTKYNQSGPEISVPTSETKKSFIKSNVSSSAGSIPKVAKVSTNTDVITQEDVKILYPKQRQQRSFDFTQAEVDKALDSDTKSQEIIAKGLQPKEGQKVGIRLNLNVLKNKGVPIQTVHKGQVSDKYKKVDGKSGFFGGEAINYSPAVTLKDAYLNTSQRGVYKVKEGETHKYPIASVDGLYQEVPLADTNFDGVEIRFNPMTGNLFETMDGRPVRSVEEATVVGFRVYGRGKIEYFTEANKPKPYTPEKSTKQRQQLPDGYFVQETGKGEFTLMKENRRAGEMSIAELQSDKPSVSQVYLRPTDKGLGLAPDMYREIAKAMESKGKTLVSSMYTNNASQGVWKRLVKDGDAEVIGSRIDAEGKFRNMYSFIPSKPKQRQQKAGVDKLAKMYNMESNGVILAKPGIDRVALEEWANSLGFKIKTTKGDRGQTTSYQLMKDGKRYKPGDEKKSQRQQVSDVLNKDMSAVEIINVARANNFRGPAIKDYLVRVKKMKVKEVDALLKIPLTMFSSIPEAFTNIKEGMNEGIKFYTDILKKTVTWQIKNKATDAQAFDKAVQLLEESKIFQNQADKNRKSLSTLQKEMIVGMQKSLGVRPMKNTNLKLRVLRQSLKDTKRGAKELKSVQSKLRNFIRRSLPKKLYTKGEITTLISDVTNATEANIDNLIQKVIDKITTIQVADLESTIQKLMDDNYEKIESGREKGKKIIVDVNDRLKALKKDMVTDSMVADDVVKRNLELNQEFNEITNKSEQLSEGDLNRLMDLAVLINLNNATLMNNTDVNKVESLNKAAELLTQIVGKGKELFKAQLKKDHQKYLKNKETLYEQVTGEKIDMSDPEQVAKAKKAEAKGKARKNKRESDGLFKKSVRGLQLALSSFFKGSESLSGLMNTIDRLPGDLIGGKARKMVYSLLNESTRVYKARKMGNKQIIEAKLKEIFGKKWKSGISAMKKPIDWSATKDIFIDEKEVNEAKKLVEENPTRENKKNLKKVIEENTIVMSQDEILYQYQQFQDPANLASFMNESNFLYRGDPKRILESLMEQVDPKNKEVADWMVEEFYPSLYEHYNKTYKAIYRTNLPWNDKYAGRIYREASAPNPLDLLGTDVKSNNQVSAASTKVRRMNDKPIVKMGMMQVMMTYTTDMEWFASHAEAIRDINKMFDDPLIAQAIEQNNGEGTLLLIRDSIQKIARRGINNAARGKFMNAVNNMFIAARLGANPTIFLKQMTSFITYANDIGIVNYMKYAAINKTEALKVYKEIWNNSVYVQDRASERIEDVLESYTSLGNVEFSTKENYITKLMMSPVKYGDLGAIFLGGSPNYSFYKAEFQKKNPKATEQQAIDYAIRKFENDTKNTQQSSDLQDKDYYQTADPVVRAFNMFLTTPKQYLRKEFGAIRNLYRKLAAWDRKAGQGTVSENIRQLAMYHFVMPLFFQFVAMGFPDLGDLEDEEKEDLLRAGILGNFNALFIAGDVLTMIADAVQEKPWAGTTKSLAPLNVMSEIANLYTRAEKTKDPTKKAELTQKMMLRITEVALTPTGKNLPLVNIAKYVKNLNELGEGGSEKDFMRLFNYSKYVIDKEGKDKGTKLSKKEMQLYFPDLYEQEMALDKELKELNKELELELDF